MNRERFAGLCRQFAGSMNEAWGECFHDRRRVAAGRRAQIIGKVQQANAIAQEQADRQLTEFRHQHRNWLF